jgi:dTDP-4-amino-4,6-dideoxygalactose transaminase
MIPFNRPAVLGNELEYIRAAMEAGHLSGDGRFTKRCHSLIEDMTATGKALLTHSCTAALEMAAILANVGPGDEVIMPSFTFVSTANAFVLRGATPVFVDVRSDTLNLDERLLEQAITERTKAIVPVHYAGVGCEMDSIIDIASRHGLMVIEDAAQGVGASYRGKPLGSIGDLGALSFHETKNVISGEGGALLVNNPEYAARAEIIREKGTNRSLFFRGQVDKYTWVDVGSSYLPSEIVAAFLCAQLEQSKTLNGKRVQVWDGYHAALQPFEERGLIRRPIVPPTATNNGHMYYILLPNLTARQQLIATLRSREISTVFHYIPLHSAPAGVRYGRVSGSMQVTNTVSDTLIRLPVWPDLLEQLDSVIDVIVRALEELPRDAAIVTFPELFSARGIAT